MSNGCSFRAREHLVTSWSEKNGAIALSDGVGDEHALLMCLGDRHAMFFP